MISIVVCVYMYIESIIILLFPCPSCVSVVMDAAFLIINSTLLASFRKSRQFMLMLWVPVCYSPCGTPGVGGVCLDSQGEQMAVYWWLVNLM